MILPKIYWNFFSYILEALKKFTGGNPNRGRRLGFTLGNNLGVSPSLLFATAEIATPNLRAPSPNVWLSPMHKVTKRGHPQLVTLHKARRPTDPEQPLPRISGIPGWSNTRVNLISWLSAGHHQTNSPVRTQGAGLSEWQMGLYPN